MARGMPWLRDASLVGTLFMRGRQVVLNHKVLVILALSLLFLRTLFQSDAVNIHVQNTWNDYYHGSTYEPPIGDGMPLRIMFMGASITRGEVSAGDRGYRKQIRDWLVRIGNPVNCVGTQRFGDFPDNDVEGYGAARISQLWEHAKYKVPDTQPNLILVQVGTSDCFQKDQEDPAYIFHRYRGFVDWLFETTPRATIILSTIVTTPVDDVERCVLSANAQIRQVAADLEREGKPVALAEMHWSQGLPNRVNKTDIGADMIHPTNEGYAMMGEIFMEKIRDIDAKGFLQRAVDNGIPEDGEAENIELDGKKQPEEAKEAQEQPQPGGRWKRRTS